MKRKKLSIVVLLILVLFLFTSCTTPNDNNVSENNGSQELNSPVNNTTKDSITIAINADIDTLDPQYSASGTNWGVFTNIYDTLVVEDENGEIQPNIAEKWEISDDGLSYTFFIKKGIKFHNGEEVNASDVTYTLNRALQSPFMASSVDQIASAENIDEYTMKVTLKNQYAPFLKIAAKNYFIYNEKAVTDGGDDYKFNPIGTGAYKFVSYTPAQNIELVKYDDYFGKTPTINKLTYKIINEASTALIALETGDVDMCSYVPLSSLEQIKSNPELEIYTSDSLAIVYGMINTQNTPFDNVKLRQAISYAMDRQFMIDVAREGMGDIAYTILPKATFGYSEDITKYDYNVEKSKELLKEAGFENGLDIGTIKATQAFSKEAEIMQANLNEIGITATIELLENNAYIQDLMNGNYNLAVFSISITNDASSYDMAFSSKYIDGINIARYNNPEVDKLFDEAKANMDVTSRKEQYRELFDIIGKDAPYIYLYYPKSVIVTNSNLDVTGLNASLDFKVYNCSWK